MQGVVRHLRGNAVAYLALFFALGGVSYAAQNALLDERGAVRQHHIAKGAVSKNKLDRKLRHRLGLDTQLPQDGEFIGQGSSPDSSQPVDVIVIWDTNPVQGGPGITRIVVRSLDASGPCFFQNYANDFTFEGSNGDWQFTSSAVQPGDNDPSTLGALGDFVDATHIEFAGALIQHPDGTSCVAPRNLVLRWQPG